MERIDLTKISDEDKEMSREIIFQMARDFAPLIDLDFDKDVLPALEDDTFWDVDYLKDSKWGLSVMDAYRCLVDVHRTTQIMGGIRETIESLKENGEDEIYAIDAGTGTGVFAIYLAAIGVEKVFALELNQQTAELAQKFIDGYGFSDKVHVIVGDATKMDIPELRERPADILVSENLSGGLFAEPQFQIINHLSRFLTPDAPIIPYGAELSVSLGNGNWDKINWNGKDPRNIIAARRIPDLTRSTNQARYASVLSQPGMVVPRIIGGVSLSSIDESSINAILISTVFQINTEGKVYKLESDSAEFLGKTIAIKLPQDAYPKDGQVNLDFSYDAGFSVKNNPDALTVSGSNIKLTGHLY